MAPKGGKGGKAVKEENERQNQAKAKVAAEKKEEEKWQKGAEKKDSSKEEKRLADLARKQEAARLLAAEEASLPKAKAPAKSKAAAKAKVIPPAGPGALAAGGGLAKVSLKDNNDDVLHAGTKFGGEEAVEALAATGIESMLDALEIVNQKSDKASLGSKAAGIEAHPERRFKAAYQAYEERELPIIRKEEPGLRLQQYKERLFKQFQKHPDNPFNQTTVDYNATKEDKVAALKAEMAAKEKSLRH